MVGPKRCLQHRDGPNRYDAIGAHRMAEVEPLTQDALRQLFNYDPLTGIFRWKLRDHDDFASDRARSANRGIAGKQAGSIAVNGYVQIGIGRKKYFGHRLAWLWMTGKWPEQDVDHLNGRRDDNRWSNLRSATRGQNHQNRVGHEMTGVTWHSRTKRWRAVIGVNGRQHELGMYSTPEEAASAYSSAKREMHQFQPVVRTE